MVSKEARMKKEKKTQEKRKRTVCVKLHKKVKVSILAQLLPTIHPSIEKVHFPRQDPPKFAFLVCEDVDQVPKLINAIKEFKNDYIGTLKPKQGPRPEKLQEQLRPLTRSPPSKAVLDPLTLVLTTPIDITQDMVKKLAPNFSKINSFVSGSNMTFLLQFETLELAFDAFEDITISPVQGINVKYFKKKVEQTRKRSASTSKQNNEEIEIIVA